LKGELLSKGLFLRTLKVLPKAGDLVFLIEVLRPRRTNCCIVGIK
jgi:hypothetical protein